MHDREMTQEGRAAGELVAETLIGHRQLLEALRKRG